MAKYSSCPSCGGTVYDNDYNCRKCGLVIKEKEKSVSICQLCNNKKSAYVEVKGSKGQHLCYNCYTQITMKERGIFMAPREFREKYWRDQFCGDPKEYEEQAYLGMKLAKEHLLKGFYDEI